MGIRSPVHKNERDSKSEQFIIAATSVCCRINLLTPNVNYSGRTAPLTSKVTFYIFIQQIQVLNILNTVYTLGFFSSKCSLFHNYNVFSSCIIHILYTGCAKIKKNNSGAKRLIQCTVAHSSDTVLLNPQCILLDFQISCTVTETAQSLHCDSSDC